MKKIKCPKCEKTKDIGQSVIDHKYKNCLYCGYFWKIRYEENGEFYSELKKNNPLYS